MTGFIYAIRCGEFVKIGYATNPWKRRLQIRLCNPYPCDMLGFSPGALVDEKSLHSKFAAYHHRGEWFRLEGLVAEFVAGLENRETRYDRRKGPRTPAQLASAAATRKTLSARREKVREEIHASNIQWLKSRRKPSAQLSA